jgi:hypothetical protein
MGIYIGANLTATYTSLEEGNAPSLGDIHFGPDGKVYKFVQYMEGTAATDGVDGEVAYYYTLDGHKLNQVTSDLSDSIEIGAGVLQANVSDEEYCWIQIKGAATLSIGLTAGTDGDLLTPTGAGDGTLDVSATALSDHICAIAGDHSDNEIICDFPW